MAHGQLTRFHWAAPSMSTVPNEYTAETRHPNTPNTRCLQDVEQVVQGCLRSALFDLRESADHWGLLDEQFAADQEHRIYQQSAAELLGNKLLCLQVAREHGLAEEFAAGSKVHGNLGWRHPAQRECRLPSTSGCYVVPADR